MQKGRRSSMGRWWRCSEAVITDPSMRVYRIVVTLTILNESAHHESSRCHKLETSLCQLTGFSNNSLRLWYLQYSPIAIGPYRTCQGPRLFQGSGIDFGDASPHSSSNLTMVLPATVYLRDLCLQQYTYTLHRTGCKHMLVALPTIRYEI
jgi:hypothetical protein